MACHMRIHFYSLKLFVVNIIIASLLFSDFHFTSILGSDEITFTTSNPRPMVGHSEDDNGRKQHQRRHTHIYSLGDHGSWKDNTNSNLHISDQSRLESSAPTNTLDSLIIDNRIMREMYLMSIEQMIVSEDLFNSIAAISSDIFYSEVEINKAVSTIVNLKLIHKLQFAVLKDMYAACKRLDSHNITQSTKKSSTKNSTNGIYAVKFLSNTEPACFSQAQSSNDKDEGCSPELCTFYLHCVLHQKQCSEEMLEMATLYLMNSAKVQTFMISDATVDRAIAKSILLSQFAPPPECIKFTTQQIEKHGAQVGFLQAKVLARVRSGLTLQNIKHILEDSNQALLLDEKSEDAIYRKASILLAVSQCFEVLELLEMGISYHPLNADFHVIKGSCLLKLLDLAEAERSFRKALELNVGDKVDTMRGLALAIYQQGKLSKAIVVYKEMLQIKPTDSSILMSIAHCYREQGEGKRAVTYANKAVKAAERGKLPLKFRGSLYHLLGNDHMALKDFKKCNGYDESHKLCMYHAGVSYASLGQFYEAVKCMVQVTSGLDVTKLEHKVGVTELESDSHQVKAAYLTNYFRYLHSKLDQSLASLDVDADLHPAFKHGWVKSSPPELYFSSLQPLISPDIPAVVGRAFSSYEQSTQRLLCRAQHLGKLMQVKADSFLPNKRFNMAMGLAAIHVGQHLRNLWMTAKKSSLRKLKWTDLYSISVPYRRLAILETPVLWLSEIFADDHVVYQHEVPFYRSQVRNRKMNSYFEHIFNLMRRKIKEKIIQHYSQSGDRIADIEIAKTPEDLVAVSKPHLPTKLLASVPSVTNPSLQLEGATIILSQLSHGSAYLYMEVETSLSRTVNFDIELSNLYTNLIQIASKLRTNSVNSEAAIDEMLSMSYFFFTLGPLSRGSASVGLSTLMGMLLSIDMEVMMSFPAGKMLDMEATLAGGRAEFLFSVKHWFKLGSMISPITTLPLVSNTFPTVRSLLELLSNVDDIECDDGFL